MQARIRDAELSKVPYMLIVGKREAETGKVAVRARGAGDLGAMPLADFTARVEKEIQEKR